MNYYKAIVKVVAENSKNLEMLVNSDSIFFTEEKINRFYDGTNVEFETLSISKTKIIDIIGESGDKKYKCILKSESDNGKEFKTEHIIMAFDITDAKDKASEYAGEISAIHSLVETKISDII